jgi:hypothetical protein
MAIKPSAAGPLILCVGSADESRTDYDPRLVSAKEAPQAAEQIGEALAKAGCRIVVFSSDPAYLEADVARGFLKGSAKNATRRIQVRAPYGSAGALFQLGGVHANIIDLHPDQDSHWVAPFYRAMRDANGIVVIGGGRAALIIGHLALAMHVPLLAVACFGGSARRLWMAIKPGTDLPTQEECNEMGRDEWRSEYAPRFVKILTSQIERGVARETARRQRPKWRAVLGQFLVLAVVGILVAGNGGTLWAALLFGVGPVAGSAGAVTRSLTSQGDADSPQIVTTVLFGAVSGLIVSLIYLIAQFSAAGAADQIKPIAIIWITVTALGAGFAFDRTLKKLAEGQLKPGGKETGT